MKILLLFNLLGVVSISYDSARPRPGYQQIPPPVYSTIAPGYSIAPSLPKCWRNKEGFECCSKRLERLIKESEKANSSKWKGCNMQKVVNDLQRIAQNRFKFSFEAIVAQSNLANLNRFRGNLMCKVRLKSGMIAVLYATSKQYSLESAGYHRLTLPELSAKKWTREQKRIRSTKDI
ncbi:hypothetical protein KIN20_016057 [Parelaphostrongylus tenuis]|uniref:Ground-like domain-containing protein n=1 Tax=Parelaphostrongylus tenuis TaxID=148309 RepID=A0AAD5MZC2_PARTN|nr:hypothetical protein KIN20_016057 [Parelaphostrongylus tenuis]